MALSDAPERFVEHPDPDRFFMQIEPAEVEMDVHDHDDVELKSQHVPGGRFGFELSARYTYAGRDCTQIMSLNRAAAESLYERLGEVLEVDPRGDRGGYEGFYVRGEPAEVDAVVTVDGDRYVLARSDDEAHAIKHRHLPDEQLEKIAAQEDTEVYRIDG